MAPRDGQALFAAILQAPEDDALRLVYADWLDENGDAARAEFIRVQISGSDPERETELLRRYQNEWLSPLTTSIGKIERAEFRRGLLWRLGLPEATDEQLIALRTVPELERLELYDSSVTDNGMAHLAAVSNLRHVELLDTQVTEVGIAALGALDRLVLVGNPEGMSETHPVLESLRAARNRRFLALPTRSRRAEALIAVRILSDEHAMDVGEDGLVRHLSFNQRILTDADLVYLGQFPELESLDFVQCSTLTADGLVHLAGLHCLRSLDLSQTSVTDLEPLADLVGLEELSLDRILNIPPETFRHLLPLQRLRKLSLIGCYLPDAVMPYLAQLLALEELDLLWNEDLTDAGLEHLAVLPHLHTLFVDRREQRTELLRSVLSRRHPTSP